MAKTKKNAFKKKSKMRSYRQIYNPGTKKGGVEENQKTIISTFLETLNCIKLYHWKTYSYSTHKATDELYTQCNNLFDQYVEIMLGKTLSRVDFSSSKVRSTPLVDFASSDLEGFRRYLDSFKSFLLNLIFEPSDSDLATVRDEILANINQFLYLSTFSK